MSDQFYDKVSLLLPMFGVNNGAEFPDYSPVAKTISRFGNTVTVTAQSKYYGSSGYFDGVYTSNGEHLTVPKTSEFDFGGGDFTIEAWVRLNAYNSTNATILSTSFVSSPYYSVRFRVLSTGALYFGLSTNSGSTLNYTVQSAGAAVALNKFHHVAAVRSGGSIFVFVDGVLSATTSGVSGSVYYATRDAVHIGVDPSTSATPSAREYFNGYMQDLRVTVGLARYTSNFTPPARLVGQISGTVTDDTNANVARIVKAVPRIASNSQVFTTTSAANGTYSLWAPCTEHSVVCLDDTAGTVYNDLVHRVVPT